MKLTFRKLARIEFDDASNFHESRQAGLGDRFTEAVNDVLKEIALHPRRFAEFEDGVREAPVDGFSHYVIYYQILKNEIYVISVFHSSRDPAEWRKRVF